MSKKSRATDTAVGMSAAEARSLLKSVELRCTASRVVLLQHLAKSSQPISHTELAATLSESGFDASTVFRGLVELAEAGLLTRLDVGDQVRRYELKHFTKETGEPGEADHYHADDHPHFVCVDCGTVTCLPDVKVTLSNSKDKVISPGSMTEILIKGHCNKCE